MGILEIILIIAVALKMAGVAFAAVSYWALVGYYAGAVVVVFLFIVLVFGIIAAKAKGK